jgi:hypothetical protein
MTQADQQRARRDRAERLSAADRARHERERRAERLIAEVLSVLSQRDVLVAALETRAGRCLAEVRALGWPGVRATAAACDLSLHEAARLRALVEDDPPATVGAQG